MSMEFTDEERAILGRYFTNVDRAVFGLRNLPEVTKAALFARYSRSPKSLRRLFLNEFYEGGAQDSPEADQKGVDRAEGLFSRVLSEYGDDSVAQLAGVHVALEELSNIATKVIERPRLAAYLEQSTRYIPYDTRDSRGQFRYVRPPELSAQDLATYEVEMDALFSSYSDLSRSVMERLFAEAGGFESVAPPMRATLRAFGLDATRGLLPAATRSNVGIYASAQAMEQLVLHLYAHPLGELRDLGAKLHAELNLMIPSLVSRLNRDERRDPWVAYISQTRHLPAQALGGRRVIENAGFDGELGLSGSLGGSVDLVDFDASGEAKITAAILFERFGLGAREASKAAASMGAEELDELWREYHGSRENRRHRPSRALERTSYHFEVVCDYGAFRDLQRHRLLSIAWAELDCSLGYYTSSKLTEAEAASYSTALERAASYHLDLAQRYGPKVAAYCVPMAFRMRFDMEINAREAMHLIELRTTPQGHESYREIAQLMYRAISEFAGHHRVAAAMRYVDLSAGDQGRLASLEREDARARPATVYKS